MKFGLGLYRSLLTTDNFQFAKQAGVSHLVNRPTSISEC
jgi:hypothetical protein